MLINLSTKMYIAQTHPRRWLTSKLFLFTFSQAHAVIASLAQLGEAICFPKIKMHLFQIQIASFLAMTCNSRINLNIISAQIRLGSRHRPVRFWKPDRSVKRQQLFLLLFSQIKVDYRLI